MKEEYRRNPKSYDGSALTTHHARDVAPTVLRSITAAMQEKPELVLATWPGLIGAKLAPMAQAVAFADGVLTVRVKNSTLFSLLSQRDKPRLLTALRKQLPGTTIYDIVFRMS